MKKNGFTILELLVVILIIGVVTTMVTLEYIDHLKNSRNSKRKADLNTISVALEMYRNDQSNTNYQYYPYNNIDAVGNPTSSKVKAVEYLTHPDINELKYFSNISDDPLATKDASFSYWYMTTNNNEGKGKEFKLEAKLEDEDIEMKNDGGNSDDYYEKFSTGGSSINLNN